MPAKQSHSKRRRDSSDGAAFQRHINAICEHFESAEKLIENGDVCLSANDTNEAVGMMKTALDGLIKIRQRLEGVQYDLLKIKDTNVLKLSGFAYMSSPTNEDITAFFTSHNIQLLESAKPVYYLKEYSHFIIVTFKTKADMEKAKSIVNGRLLVKSKIQQPGAKIFFTPIFSDVTEA
jgi:hypothetical protein